MLVSSFDLTQSFAHTPYLYYKKQFKTEINCFCIFFYGPCIQYDDMGSFPLYILREGILLTDTYIK